MEDGLWEKLQNVNIQGKCLEIIQNMYNNIKSRVTCNKKQSDYFPSNVGVRQGEILSPILFSLF